MESFLSFQGLTSLLGVRATLKLQVMSDLHLEVCQQYSTFEVPLSAPYLVLAGDIGRLSDYSIYLDFLGNQCDRFVQVFLVLGNHEFFGVSREEGLRLASTLEREPILNGRLTVLNRTRFDLGREVDASILGCTLQSHILPEARDVVKLKVKDFQRILDWTIDDHNAEHKLDVEWLRQQIESVRNERNGRKRRIIVITHHAPSLYGTSKPSDIGNPWSSAFATNLITNEAALVFSDVQWWIFGHTHYTTEFSIGRTKLISNQRGYVVPDNETQISLHARNLQSIIKRNLVPKHRSRGVFDVRKMISI